MQEAASEERFEAAARYRDRIAALDALRQRQKVVGDPDMELDIISAAHGDLASVVTVLAVRGGALSSKEDFVFSGEEILEADSITGFALAY